LDFGAQAGQQHVIHHERLRAAGFQQQERFAVVLRVDVAVAVLGLQAAHMAVTGGAGAGHHGLATQVIERLDTRVGAHEHADGRHIVRHAERHLLLALQRIGIRRAVEIDQAVDHGRNRFCGVSGSQRTLMVLSPSFSLAASATRRHRSTA
jgi:hypothetical protein